MPSIRLKANPFAEPEYFHTDVTKGVTRTPTGTRICTLPSDFLLGFRDAVIYECGKSYRGVMKSAGKRWGVQFIKRLDREMTAYYGQSFRELPKGLQYVTIAETFAYHGYGRLVISNLKADEAWLTVELFDSVMPSLVRESERPVDMLMSGLLGAIFSHLSTKSLDAVQTDCPSLGSDRSRFLVGPAVKVGELAAWIEETDPSPTHDDAINKLFNTSDAEMDTPIETKTLAGA
jgi:predicted hydrocarbon binding protein